MTREEEIGSRLENAQVNASSYPVTVMDADIAYLLARNDGLQRRVDKLEELKGECAYALDIADAEQAAETPAAWKETLEMGQKQYEVLRELVSALDAADAEENNTCSPTL